ncbi:hypothetical protein FRB96_007699 [Tulasnella sp. 330]|nr:hypothetical protein FRB96_007699 [Tulasnella sp. 330]
MRTPGYIQVIGLFNQTSINLDPTDPGGELDPHDDDQLGNPIGVSDLGYQNTAGVPPAAVTTATTTPHAAATDSAAESRSDSPSVAAPTTTTTSDSKSGSTSGALSATSSMSTGWLVVVLLDLRRCLIDAGVMPPGITFHGCNWERIWTWDKTSFSRSDERI